MDEHDSHRRSFQHWIPSVPTMDVLTLFGMVAIACCIHPFNEVMKQRAESQKALEWANANEGALRKQIEEGLIFRKSEQPSQMFAGW